MATISEDYVSFETAKLLKEKGFDNTSPIMYKENGEVCINPKSVVSWRLKYWYPCLTLQMAIKWLREVHNLSVEVYRTACGYIGCVVAIPSGTDIKFLEEDGDDLPSGQYTKWEYACEAAIKYCLEKLI